MEPTGTITAYEPTWRERASNALADLIGRTGVGAWKANKLAQTVLGGERSNLPLGLGLSDLALMAGGGGNALMRAAGVPAGLLAYADASKQGNPFSALTVWHGSPHKMAPTPRNPLGEFDPTKIGTGEGAQAYGMGHYLAESPKTAQWYAESLAGKQYSPSDLVSANGVTLNELMKGATPLARAKVTSYVNNAQGDMAKASADFDAFVQKQIRENGALTEAGKSVLAEAQGWMRKLADAKISFIPKPTGSLYKVDLPDSAIARMLDWDAPLSQQTPEVRAAIAKLPKKWVTGTAGERRFLDPSASRRTGGGLLADLQMLRSGRPEELLRQVGIPGIKYFDSVSRDAGQGTRNYVVFPGGEDLLTILERNGMTK